MRRTAWAHPARHWERGRRAISLLEVILALSLLAITMLLVAQLVSLGIRSAADARDFARAQRICENIVAELTAGALLPVSQSDVPARDEPDWLYSIETRTLTGTGLMALSVTVKPRQPNRQDDIQVTVTRWIVDPTSPLAPSATGRTSAGRSNRPGTPPRTLGG